MHRLASLVLAAILTGQLSAAGIRFSILIDAKLADTHNTSGRLLIGIAPKGQTPRYTSTDPYSLPLLGIDVNRMSPEKPVIADASATTFPADSLKRLLKGEYSVQAVLVSNRDINLPNAPRNLFSDPVTVMLDPASDQLVKIHLSQAFTERTPATSKTHHYLQIASPRLSKHFGRPMVYRVAVVLPTNFEEEKQSYPLVVHIGGFGTRYTSAQRMRGDNRFVQILLDGAGPFGDPYQVNSANNGPYGDALIYEVIPFIEKTYRCIGTPKTRFTTGGSTGGWVSLALQMFYPDQFNGCWSLFPDSVDFHSYELIDIYRDANAYVNRYGFERPAKRTIDGDTIYTVRHECQIERVLGLGGRWELSGRDWASWNATYGPRGKDGLPQPLWNGETGELDRTVVEHWKKYDLRDLLETQWKTLGPKLAGGKINIWVGDADDYFLNNGVHRFKAAAKNLTNPTFDGVIEIEMRKGHGGGWTRMEIFDAMAKRAK